MLQNSSNPHKQRSLLFSRDRLVNLAKKLPGPIKNFLLSCFWMIKAFLEDFQDYSAEIIGYIPAHFIRITWYRWICRIKIGKYSSIHRHCRMYHPYKIIIGDHSIINYGVLLDGRRGLQIGNNVSISEGTVILTLGHDIDKPNFDLKGGKVIIEDYVFIGSYARILPAVKIGEGAVVAAGSVVTRDIEPYSVVGGVPARFIRKRECNPTYQLKFRKRFG